MSAREAILSSLRHSLQGSIEVPLPETQAKWIEYPDLEAQFVAAAEEAHARCVRCSGDWQKAIGELEIVRESNQILSLVEGLSCNSFSLDASSPPHAASVLDLTIARGRLGVAESGAIWVTGKGIAQRSALFLAQHLILLLEVNDIVPHLHAAYEQLDITEAAFGCFIAGPSKTADIEQALVVGAHGPRSLTIVLH